MLNNSPLDAYQQQWLLQLYEQAPIAIGTYLGEQHVINFANPLMCEMWGRRPEQVLNRPLFEALPEVAQQGFEEILVKVFHTGEPFSGEELPVTLERKGKLTLCYFNVLYKPLTDSQNKIVGIVQVASEVTPLVKARQAAERNEQLLRMALEGGKMGTWYVDLVENSFSRSDEYDRIFGYKEQLPSFDFDTFMAHVHPDDKEHAANSHKQSLKRGSTNYEVRIRRTDEQLRWVQVKGAAIYNLKGTPISVSGVITDVTEQKQAMLRERQLAVERAARTEIERQRSLLNNLFMSAPALISTLQGPHLVFELVNPQYQQLFPGRTLVGKPLLEAVPELKDQPIYHAIRQVYEEGQTYIGYEVPIQLDQKGTGELSQHYFNTVYQALRDSSGAITGIVVFGHEVTEQINARRLIEHSESNLRIALNAGKMGIWHLDLVSNTSSRSLQHDQIFGYNQSLQEWGYHQLMEHVVPEDKEVVADQFSIAHKYGDLRFEARIRTATQELRWISVLGQTFYENNKPMRMAGVIMDITERKLVEEKLTELTEELAVSNSDLKRANEEIKAHMLELSKKNQQLLLINADLDNFIYTASHDLKTPISNIEGLTKLLLRNIPDATLQNESVKKTLDLIEASIKRFKHTIVELTDIAKLQKDGEEISLISIPEIVKEVELDLHTLIQDAEAQIEKRYLSCHQLQFSHKNMKSIIYNLLSNAIKYSAPDRKPHITVSCYQEDGQPVICVADNGLGIKEPDLKKIFSMYTRLHNHVEGTGVGLYLVKRIMDNAGGRLEVESEVNKGTSFKIIFPSANNTQASK